jgi:hypothetical protein
MDLIETDEFRNNAVARIKTVDKKYRLPTEFPNLYRYRSFGSYVVNDVINKKITLTTIENFNDVYDGVITSEYNEKFIKKQLKTKLKGVKCDKEKRKLVKEAERDKLKRQQKYNFSFTNSLGTYIGCFSEIDDSILMWAHYADMNKGLCIEYDFNKTKQCVKNLLFPVSYSKNPVYTDDLFDGKTTIANPEDVGVLCSILNKSMDWMYEKEYRFVWVFNINPNGHPPYFPITPNINPSSICFGFHFMKNFYYREFGNNEDHIKALKQNMEDMFRLLDYMKNNNITAKIQTPSFSKRKTTNIIVSVDDIIKFMHSHLDCNDKPKKMDSYHLTVYDLLDLLNKKKEQTNG